MTYEIAIAKTTTDTPGERAVMRAGAMSTRGALRTIAGWLGRPINRAEIRQLSERGELTANAGQLHAQISAVC